jgi:hypothetical protein
MSAVVITFPPPGSSAPEDEPVVIPLQPRRLKIRKAERARCIRIPMDVALGYDLSVTVQGQSGRTGP